MQTAHKNKKLNLILIPIILTGALLLVFAPQNYLAFPWFLFWSAIPMYVYHIYKNWHNSKKIEKRFSTLKATGLVVAFELLILGALLCITQIWQVATPLVHQQISLNATWFWLLQLGVFPWPLVAIIAIKLNKITYLYGKYGRFSSICQQSPTSDRGMIIDNIIGKLNNIGYSLLLLMACLFSLILIFNLLRFPLNLGPNLLTMLSATISAALCFQFIKKRLKSTNQKFAFSKYNVAFIGFFVISFSIAYILLAKVSQLSLPIHSVVTNWLAHFNLRMIWLNLTALLFALFVPIISMTIASIMKGYHARHIMVACMSPPVMIYVLCYKMPVLAHIFSIKLVIAFVGLICIIGLFFFSDYLQLIKSWRLGFLAKPNKANSIVSTKHLATGFYATLLSMLVYFVTSLPILYCYLMVLCFAPMLVLYLCLIF